MRPVGERGKHNAHYSRCLAPAQAWTVETRHRRVSPLRPLMRFKRIREEGSVSEDLSSETWQCHISTSVPWSSPRFPPVFLQSHPPPRRRALRSVAAPDPESDAERRRHQSRHGLTPRPGCVREPQIPWSRPARRECRCSPTGSYRANCTWCTTLNPPGLRRLRPRREAVR
jgi:hypothetical protein